MKKIILLLGVMLLAACNDQPQIVQSYKYMVVHPSELMYYCPVLEQFPNWKTLTDSQVAKLIVQLQKNNLTCKSSIESIKDFLNSADLELKKGS
jgi:uncharacterized lipoprotein YajG